jgi:hypothetical protein
MPDNITHIQNDDGTNKRIKRNRAVIKSGNDELVIYGEQLTEVSPSGDMETNENQYSMVIEGELVSHASQMAGKCQELECGRWLTHRTIRFCFYCGKVNCIKCCKWDEKDERWICKKCYRSIKWKRILRAIARVIFFPFFRREDS